MRPPRASTPIEEADIALSARISGQRRHPLVKALGMVGELGDQPPLLVLCTGVLAFGVLSGRRRVAVAGANMLLSFVLATAMKTTVKRMVSRTRPNVVLDEGTYAVEPLGPNVGPWQSMPSGHTAGSVAVARALARTCPEAALPAYAAAATIAFAQLPTAHHFATDVAAGAAIGFLADAITERASGLAPSLLDASPERNVGDVASGEGSETSDGAARANRP
jgi:membrane-associated phospholipid phosphatase